MDRIERYLDDRPDYWLGLLRSARAASGLLVEQPGIGTPLGRGLRKLRLEPTPYLLLYRYNSDELRVLRIRHERENWRPSK